MKRVRMISTAAAAMTALASTQAWAQIYHGQGGGAFGGSCPIWGGGGSWFGMGFMWFFWILVLVAIIGGIRWLFRSGGPGQDGGRSQAAPRGPEPGGDPLKILQARYASGEISKEQYESIKADLGL